MKRLQVLIEEEEYGRFREAARRSGVSLAAWVRRALRLAWRDAPLGDRDRKLDVIRAAAKHAYPTADVDRMLDDIERGYRSPETP